MKHHPRHNRLGFTLMELIVSIAIVSFMLFLINRIFFDTTEAVSRGIATSKIIANTRTVGEQIAEDFDDTSFMGPNSFTASPIVHPVSTEAGFLIIGNYKKNAEYLDGRDKDGVIQAGRDVRSDQLCFIRSTNGLTPLTDKNGTSFTGTTDAAYCRVWYGHLEQIDEAGTLTGVLGNGGDKYATSWTLGRQVLFLDDSVNNTDIYAKFDQSNWNVNGLSDFRYAQSDILNISLIESSSTGTGRSTTLGILDPLEDARDLGGVAGRSAYESALLNNKYFIHITQNMGVRTTPSINNINRNEIAQMHPYFLNNVSDFIVQFAGDYDAAPGIDKTGNNIHWYDAYDRPNTSGWTTGSLPHYRPYATAGIIVNGVFIFRHEDQANWPKLLRIRYRLHDPKGELLGTADEKPDDGIIDEEGQPGKWYEVIVKVPS